MIFQRAAMREAYEAGAHAALSDPSNMREVFDAGVKHGKGWLHEAMSAPNFTEFMSGKMCGGPQESFEGWVDRNKNRLGLYVNQEEYDELRKEKERKLNDGFWPITLDAIADAVSHVLGIRVEDLRFNTSRKGDVPAARFFVFYLAYFHIPESLADIGEYFSGKDHSMVIHGARSVSDLCGIYEIEKNKLKSMYRYLIRNKYSIEWIQDDYKNSRGGSNRLTIKKVELDIF